MDSGWATSIDAITLAVTDMSRSTEFYRSLGFEPSYGGPDADFTSFAVGDQHLNLILTDASGAAGWGRVIIHVDDVDAMHERAVAAGHTPEAPPRDAEWGERYFHLDDPDGHQLSFARPL